MPGWNDASEAILKGVMDAMPANARPNHYKKRALELLNTWKEALEANYTEMKKAEAFMQQGPLFPGWKEVQEDYPAENIDLVTADIISELTSEN